MKVKHIGYWVKDIKKELTLFKMLGYRQESEIFYEITKDCQTCFLFNGNVHLKLIEPASENSLMHELLNQHTKQNYHICYETSSVEQDINKLHLQGFEVFPRNDCSTVNNSEEIFLTNFKLGFIEIAKAS